MSKSTKNYVINVDVFNSLSAETAKLPKQQQIILKTMVENCTETGMCGSDIIALAVKNNGLETRQKYTVLYAWYARSNENFGVSVQKTTPAVIETPVEAKPKKSAKHAD
jgi:hypothetical protein